LSPYFLKLIKKRSLVPVLTVLLFVSIASSVTGLLLSDATETVAASGGMLPNNTFVVYSSSSKLPITSVLPLSLSNNLSMIPGVIQVTPEAFAPVLANGKVFILRGMNSTSFAELYKPNFISGGLGNAVNYTVFIGSTAAKQLAAYSGAEITLHGIMSNHNETLTVGGIFNTGTVLDDEIISGISTAQSMRGIGEDQASMLVVRVNQGIFNASSLDRLFEGKTTGNQNGGANVVNSALSLGVVGIGSFLAGNPSQAASVVLSRAIGVSQDVLWVLVITVSVCSILSVYYGASWTISENLDVLRLLNWLGMTRRGLIIRILTLFLALAAVSSLVGYLASTMLTRLLASVFDLSVIFQPIVLYNNPFVFPLTLVSLSTLMAVSVMKLIPNHV
jgi:hypothetical protein